MVGDSDIIYIFGPCTLQNRLLSSLIESEIGVTSLACKDWQETMFSCHRKGNVRSLILWDCLSFFPSSLWRSLRKKTGGRDVRNKSHVGLFNVRAEWRIEEKALKTGLRGILYDSDEQEKVVKGARAMLNGELWFSRAVLEKSIQGGDEGFCRAEEKVPCLTEREREILRHVAGGKSNRQMSEILNLSQHTVKTHLYNIYRKLNVSKRVKAAQWAADYLAIHESGKVEDKDSRSYPAADITLQVLLEKGLGN